MQHTVLDLESRTVLRLGWPIVHRRRVVLTARCFLVEHASTRSGNELSAPVAELRTDTCSGKLLSQSQQPRNTIDLRRQV